MEIAAALIGLGGVVVGAVIVVVSEAWRTRAAFQREKVWSFADAQKVHIERLYETLEQISQRYVELYGQARYAALFQDSESRRALLAPTDGVIPWARLHMLTNLYVPSLKPWAKQTEATGAALGVAAARIGLRGILEESGSQAELEDAFQNFRSAAERMRLQLEKESDRLARRAFASIGKDLSNRH